METETIEAIRASYEYADEKYYVIIPIDCDYHLTVQEQSSVHNFDLSFDEDSVLEQDGTVNDGDRHDGDFDSGLFVDIIEAIEYETETYESKFEQVAHEFADDISGEVDFLNTYDGDMLSNAQIGVEELTEMMVVDAFEQFEHISVARSNDSNDTLFVEGLN